MRRVPAFAIMTAVAMAGCGRPSPEPQAPPAAAGREPARSSVGTVIDGLTGKTAVDAGKRARTQIEKIGKQEQHDVNEVLQP